MSYIPNPLIIPVGIFIGIAVSAPVGPVNVLCVRRALQRGMAGGVAALAIWLVRDHTTEPDEIIARAAMVGLVLFLLSPAQFPWYAGWVLIFAPLRPLVTYIGLTVLLPLYYASFYLAGINQYASLNPWLIWLEWLPIWSLLLLDARAAWRRSSATSRASSSVRTM